MVPTIPMHITMQMVRPIRNNRLVFVAVLGGDCVDPKWTFTPIDGELWLTEIFAVGGAFAVS